MADLPDLTPKQLRLVAALMVSRTIRAACRKARVSERTARDWFKLEAFQAAWRSARQLATTAAASVLQGAAGRAARQLVAELKTARAGDRIKAACAILQHLTAMAVAADLEERLAALEAEAQARSAH